MLTKTTLRDDVSKIVTLRAAEMMFDNRDKWDCYEEFKKVLSAMCGKDAPESRRDQQQYDLAIQAFLKLAEI